MITQRSSVGQRRPVSCCEGHMYISIPVSYAHVHTMVPVFVVPVIISQVELWSHQYSHQNDVVRMLISQNMGKSRFEYEGGGNDLKQHAGSLNNCWSLEQPNKAHDEQNKTCSSRCSQVLFHGDAIDIKVVTSTSQFIANTDSTPFPIIMPILFNY